MSGPVQPEISVVLSAIDPRGVFGQVMRAWTAGQSAASERYELIAAGAVDDVQSQALAAHLRPGDRHVATDERDSSSQWARGAAEARAPYVVFSEAHGVPAPGCVAELLSRFAETGADVLALSCPGTTGSTLEWLDERFCRAAFKTRSPAVRAISPRAFAIRRAAYEDLGGVEPGTGAFGDLHFAHRVEAAGLAIADAPRAAVLHYNVPTLEQPVFCVGDFVAGEMRWRGRVPESVAWESLGVRRGLALQGNRDGRHQAAARRALRTAIRTAVRDPRLLGSARRALGGLVRLQLSERRRARREARGIEAAVRKQRRLLETANQDAEGIERFHAYWRALTEQKVERLIEAGAGAPGRDPAGLGSDRLFGFSPPWAEAGRWRRAIRGVAGLRLPPQPGRGALRIELEPAKRSGPLLVLWNGHVVGRAPAGAARFDAPPDMLRSAAHGDDDLLVFVDERNPAPKWDRQPRSGRDVVVLAVERSGGEVARRYEVSPRRQREALAFSTRTVTAPR